MDLLLQHFFNKFSLGVWICGGLAGVVIKTPWPIVFDEWQCKARACAVLLCHLTRCCRILFERAL